MARETRTISEWQRDVDAALAQMPFASIGHCPGCEDCASDFGMDQEEYDAAYEAGEIVDEPSFSWHGCDVCGSPLGGDRETVHYARKDGTTAHLSPGACVDCILYMANGDLPQAGDLRDDAADSR